MIRRLSAVLAMALVLAACSSADEPVTSPVTDAVDGTSAPGSTTEALDIPAQLTDHDLDLVVVGDRVLLLAIADSPVLRAQGLMGVEDLGDLDGMLFYWRHEASGGFWMKDTPIPLDIVWFNEDGSYAGRDSMTPCTAASDDDCPTYTPEGDPDFRFAIEARVGDLDWVDESTVIVYSD
jgi:uncharacterized membrane protein (UPF0127 family)